MQIQHVLQRFPIIFAISSVFSKQFFFLIIIPELISWQLKKKNPQRNLLFSDHFTDSKYSESQNKNLDIQFKKGNSKDFCMGQAFDVCFSAY